jgi:hypothetical protein
MYEKGLNRGNSVYQTGRQIQADRKADWKNRETDRKADTQPASQTSEINRQFEDGRQNDTQTCRQTER